MAESVTEVAVGAAVVIAAVGFVVFAGRATGFSGGAASYPLTASFRSAEGVAVGTDVRLAGVKVGTITGIDLNPKTFFADVELTVQDGIEVPTDSTALVSSEGLLGGNYLEIQPGGAPDNLGPGDSIEDTQGAVSLISLLLKFAGGSGTGAGTDSGTDAAAVPEP